MPAIVEVDRTINIVQPYCKRCVHEHAVMRMRHDIQ
jgi:hypothetical protein